MSEYKAVFNKDNHIAHRNDYPRQKHGWFGFAPAGTRSRYVRTDYAYTTKDPITGKTLYGPGKETLTEAGNKRWERDKRANSLKKPKNRVDEDELKDPDRWVKEDLESAKNVAEGVGTMARSTGELVTPFFKDPPRGRYDLSRMSDQELQAILRREQMERQYNDYFNPRQENKGRKYVETAVKVIGTTATLASTALGIALAIKKLSSD